MLMCSAIRTISAPFFFYYLLELLQYALEDGAIMPRGMTGEKKQGAAFFFFSKGRRGDYERASCSPSCLSFPCSL